jgi:uncharacterized protein
MSGLPQAVGRGLSFCSKRCADVDLNRWFSGAYVVAGKEEEDEDGPARPVPADKDEPNA